MLFLFLFSCGEKRKAAEPTLVAMDSVSTVVVVEDTLPFVEEEPRIEPVRKDGAFGDFIYYFATDTAFQRTRIVFPLPYYKEDALLKIEASDWVHEDLFMKQSYYTVLLNKEEEAGSVFDEEETSVQVEWVSIPARVVNKYYFERVDGFWKLEAVNCYPMAQSKHIDFIDFYARFVTDSLYQRRHISEPLQFVTTDPDDDFDVIETTLDLDQWFAFKPPLPSEKLSNVIYGQDLVDKSSTKILQLKGVGNGFINSLFFHRKGNGKWELYKFEDVSN